MAESTTSTTISSPSTSTSTDASTSTFPTATTTSTAGAVAGDVAPWQQDQPPTVDFTVGDATAVSEFESLIDQANLLRSWLALHPDAPDEVVDEIVAEFACDGSPTWEDALNLRAQLLASGQRASVPPSLSSASFLSDGRSGGDVVHLQVQEDAIGAYQFLDLETGDVLDQYEGAGVQVQYEFRLVQGEKWCVWDG